MDIRRRSSSPFLGSIVSFNIHMGWLSSLLGFLNNLLGLGKSVVDNKREERAINNSPEMQKREVQRQESTAVDQDQKTVDQAVHGDKKSLDDLRKELGG